MQETSRCNTPAARIVRRASFITALALTAVCAGAQSYNPSLLYEFPLGTSPVGTTPLIRDTAGNIYGATNSGGANGYGSVFELVNNNGNYSETTLYSFTNGADGKNPPAGLSIDAAGNLYGVANGGATGKGTVYELQNVNGAFNFVLIHTFNGATDGAGPDSKLAIDSNGNLYGTTQIGGTYNDGVLFQIVNSAGSFTLNVLHMFEGTSNADGSYPAMVTVGPNGTLYGVCRQGGAFGYGSAYIVQDSGGTFQYQQIYMFTGANGDDATPLGPPVLDAKGNMYVATAGITTGGSVVEFPYEGTSSGALLYGSEQVLYAFPLQTNNPNGDASSPNSTVSLDAYGNIYGTTGTGGANGLGTVYELINNGGSYAEQVLYSAPGNSNGIHPSDLMIDPNGNLYGVFPFTSFTAGVGGQGPAAVWELAVQPATTTLTLAASPNPAFFGDDVTLTATVTANPATGFVPGTITFFEGSTVLGSLFTANGSATITVASNQLGAGADPITAQFTPSNPGLTGSMTTQPVVEIVNADSDIAVLSGSNTFNGSQTVNGSVSAASFIGGTFTGDGSGLTNVTAANFSGTILDSQVTGLSLDLANATATAVAQALAANSGFVPLTGGSMTGALSTPSLNATGAVSSGSLIIGGGTAITQYVSVTQAITLPAIQPSQCATVQTSPIANFTPGATDTIALGIPGSLMSVASGPTPPAPPAPPNGPAPPAPPNGPAPPSPPAPPPILFTYQAWETSTAASPTVTIEVCNVTGPAYQGGATGTVRIDIFKH